MEIVKCEKLSKIYGSGQTLVTALDQVDLSVRQGEFVAINGSSGSGKSTLLHMLGGVDRPSGGKVWIEGTDLAGLDEKQSSIFIRQNILLPMLLDGRRPDEKRFDELVETLGLKDRLTHLPSQISGGQQQRAAIARALIYRPAILLADEPTGNLDRRNSDEILGLLKLSNKKYRQTILLITHDERVAVEADRVITIEDGKIIADERIRPNEENCKEGICGEVGR